MAICKLSEMKGFNYRHGLGQCLKIVLPMLVCVSFIYCSKSLYLYLTEGHHVGAETSLRRMMQSAAFVAPATAYMFHIFGYGPVLFIGGCFTILGILAPSLPVDARLQELAFAVLFGSGISIVFQATSMASSPIFRSNVVYSVLLLGLCAVAMSVIQQLFEEATIKFPVRFLIGALILVPLTFILPSVVALIGARRAEKNTQFQQTVSLQSVWTWAQSFAPGPQLSHKVSLEKLLGWASSLAAGEETDDDDDDPPLNLKIDDDDVYSEDENPVNMSLCSGKDDKKKADKDKESKSKNESDTENNIFNDLTLEQLKWRICALLWWSIGIHLSFLSNSRDPSANMKMIVLMCFFSLFTFGVIWFLSDRKSGFFSGYDSNNNTTGYFVLGLLGINGFLLRFYPLSTDVHCFTLLFTVGFLHQLQPSYKMHTNLSDFGLLINLICIEFVLTFCAMAIGYFVTNIIYNNVLALIVTSNSCLEVSLCVISAANVLLSLRYSIKTSQKSPNSTMETECYDQA